MLHALKDLHGYAIESTDGEIGHVAEAYFDDQQWTIRYIVVKTGSWLDTREVLLSPIALGEQHWDKHVLKANLTRAKVEHSPSIDIHKPVSRQQETKYNAYFGWSPYWGGADLWSRYGIPLMMATPPSPDDRNQVLEADDDPHLRSSREITGYHVHGTDANIGHIADFIFDDESWAIRYLVVNTSNWGFGHDVLIAPEWIKAVHEDTSIVDVLVPRGVIADSPIWDPSVPVSRAYEDGLRAHYGVRQARSLDPRSREVPIAPRPHLGK